MKTICLLVSHCFALSALVHAADAPKPQIILNFIVSEPSQEAGKSDVLSCPTVVTIAGQEAVIAIGKEVPAEGPAQGAARPIQLGFEIRSTPEPAADGSIAVTGSINLRSLAKEQPQAAEKLAWKAVHSLESTFALKLTEGESQNLTVPPCPDHPRGLQVTLTARILGQANAAVSYLKAFSLLPKLDPEENKILKELNANLGAAHRDLFKKAQAALAALDEADAAAHCDWQLDMSKGPELSLPYLSSSLLLSRFALLQARIQWLDGDPAAAIASWQQTLNLRKACAEPPLYISELVGVAIEKLVINELLRLAPKFTPAQRAEIAKMFHQLPPLDPKRGILAEKQAMLPWIAKKMEAALNDKDGTAMNELSQLFPFGEGPESLSPPVQEILKNLSTAWAKSMLKTLEADFDLLLQAVSFPEAEQQAKLDELRKSLVAREETAMREISKSLKEGKVINPDLLTAIPSMVLLPSNDVVLNKILDCKHQRLLFLAAVEFLDQPDAISTQWPLKHLPIRLEKTPTGFTLECDSVSGDKSKVIRLSIGE
jgi:hypothetical protein